MNNMKCQVGSCLLCIALLVPESRAQIDSKAVDFLSKAEEAHSRDWTRLKDCVGKGECQWVSSDGERYWNCHFDFELNDNSMWMDLTSERAVPESPLYFSRLQLAADGENMAVVRDSEKIKPSGCQTDVWSDHRKSIRKYGPILGFDLRAFLCPEFARSEFVSGISADAIRVAVHSSEGDLTVVVVEYKEKGLKWWYSLDSSVDYRIVKAESTVPQFSAAVATYAYTYKRDGGVVLPSSISFSQIDHVAGDTQHSLTYEIDGLSFPSSRAHFNLSSLEACDESRLIDRRPTSAVKVRHLAKSVIESLEDSSIEAQVQEMPARSSSDSEFDKGEPRKWLFMLMIANVVLVSAAAWVLWRRKRSSEST